jgi:hypothetical protein
VTQDDNSLRVLNKYQVRYRARVKAKLLKTNQAPSISRSTSN